MTRHSLLAKFKQAKQIARDHGLLVVEKAGRYLVYRRLAMRNEFIAERGSPEALYTLVCKITNFH